MKTATVIAFALMLPASSFSQECMPCMMSLKSEPEISPHDSALCVDNGELKLNSGYVKELNLSHDGFAVWGCGGTYGNLFIDRHGKVVLWGVANIDNGADYFQNGLVRIVRNGKWGYADRNGTIVVEPKYDGALPFDNGTAKACVRCKEKCVRNSNCEYHYFAGGKWFALDTLGKAVAETGPSK